VQPDSLARKWFNLSDTVIVEDLYYSPASAVCQVLPGLD
jgi:hypothetical protein